ncbi:MAG: M20/M25/M40 family metallo-hydrolase [Gemmatimonadales bacterium]
MRITLSLKLSAILIGAFACAPAAAPPSPATSRLTADPETRGSEVRRILSTLAADSMEGRQTGSPGAKRAATFIAREMQNIGLSPRGDSAYFQKVPFASIAAANGRQRISLLESMQGLDTIPAPSRRISYNVIGVLPGSDAALRDQVVVIGAHYDHLGIGTPVNGDSVYNGADDDASGVTTVLSIARALRQGPPPKRTILFIATTGEEQGILGTQWYVKHPALPVDKMVADMEIEMIGRPDSLAGGRGKAWLTGYDRSTMGDMLRASGIPIVADPYPQFQFFERSDNIVFARIGIPAHTLSSYNLHDDYHKPSDDIDKIDFTHVTAVINAAVKAARILADGPAPQWKEGGRPAATR